MICLSSALFLISIPPTSSIFVLVSYFSTHYEGACSFLHGASSFFISLFFRVTLRFNTSFFNRCVCLFAIVTGELMSRIER
jgi:hypothetical protein